jgi:hypothetical protein
MESLTHVVAMLEQDVVVGQHAAAALALLMVRSAGQPTGLPTRKGM